MIEADLHKSPLVSVIMPVYNAGHYLKDAVQDVLHQTYQHVELICVDDGSTDGSSDVLTFFAQMDSRVRLIRTQNCGAGAARNKGMDEARGEYLIFLDADDRFETDMLSCCVNRAETQGADIVSFNGRYYDDVNQSIYGHIIDPGLDEILLSPADEIPHLILKVGDVVWNKLYRTAYVRNTKKRFQDVLYMNDIYFVHVVNLMCKRISSINQDLIYYRKSASDSLSSKDKSKQPHHFVNVINALYAESNAFQGGDYYKKETAVVVSALLDDYLGRLNTDSLEKVPELFEKISISRFKADFELLKGDAYLESLSFYRSIYQLLNYGLSAFLLSTIQDKDAYIRYLQRIANLDDEFTRNIFPPFLYLPGIPWKSRIVLYGAGKQGRHIFEQNKKLNAYKIVAWVDQRTLDIPDNVILPDALCSLNWQEFDYVAIAVSDFHTMKDIKALLDGKGMSKPIIWCDF